MYDRSNAPLRQENEHALLPAELDPRERSLQRENDTLWTRLRQLELRYDRLLHSRDRTLAEERSRLLAETITALLPTLDSLELALGMTPETSPVREGLEITCHELARTLGRFGLEMHAPRLGEPFDPHFQEAVSFEPAPGRPEGTIARLLRSGYSIDGRLLRPALVTIAR